MLIRKLLHRLFFSSVMFRHVIPVSGYNCGAGLRSFRTSASALNKIPLSILDILREAPPAPKKQKKRILILSPEETKDKALSKYVAGVSKASRKKLAPTLIQLEESDGTEPNNFTQAIDHFKPEDSISVYRANAIVGDLAKSFTKAQLVQYVKSHDFRTGRSTKQQLADTIVRKIWNSQVPGKFSKEKSLILSEESVPLTKFEMFLLLSQKGAILRNVRSAVSKFGFDKGKAELVMAGTEHQLENARIVLQSRLEGYYKEELDLASLKQLYLEKYGEFSFKEIGKNTEVYFNHLDGDKYELAALNPNQVKRIRRLLLWHLDYNLHKRDYLHLPSAGVLASAAMLPYSNDYALSWKDKFKKHRVMKNDTLVTSSNHSLQQELEKFSDENLNKFDSVLDHAYEGQEPAALTDSDLSEKTIELLESLGLMQTDPVAKEEAVVVEPVKSTTQLLSQDQKDTIYAQLTDFDYISQLKGVKKDQLDELVFTVSLGNVLFESELSELLGLPATADLQSLGYKFNTNVPLVYDELLSSCDLPDMGLVSEDPYDYSLQFKFTPSPFVEEFKDDGLEHTLAEQVKYPPIEVWMQLNNRSVPDIESLQVVTVEGENSCFVCCPQANADIKVSCQITGQVLSDEIVEAGVQGSGAAAGGENEGIQHLLDSTTSKYARVESQPGIKQFLLQSELDFSGRKPTSIAPFCDFVIAGQKVRYNYVNVSYRRELTMNSDETDIVQLSVVDGGVLGGRRLEARFVGTDGVSRASFDRLVDYVTKIVNTL